MALNSNGPVPIYKVRSLYETDFNIKLSNCMYKMDNLYEHNTPIGLDKNEHDSNSPYSELERRQDAILRRLHDLKTEVAKLTATTKATNLSRPVAIVPEQEKRTAVQQPTCKFFQPSQSWPRDLVVHARPDQPPYSALVLWHLLSNKFKTSAASHVHSSVGFLPDKLQSVVKPASPVIDRASLQYILTLIWKEVRFSPMLILNSQSTLIGEAAIARYLARLLNPGPEDPIAAPESEYWIEQAELLVRGNSKDRTGAIKTLRSRLAKSSWLAGEELTVSDIMFWSALQRSPAGQNLPEPVEKWLAACRDHPAFQDVAALVA